MRLSIVAFATFAALLFFATSARAARVVRNINATYVYRTAQTLNAGTTYQFRTTNLNPASTTDPFMHLLDSTDLQVAYNDDSVPGVDLNPLVEYPCVTGGTYYVVIRSFDVPSAGNGDVQVRSAPTGTSDWTAWSNLATTAYFGGVIGPIETNQYEYWTVARQTLSGGSGDTVLYLMSSSSTIVGYDDDSGVGRMSRWTRVASRTVNSYLLGAYSTSFHGTADIIANDWSIGTDLDTDTLGPGLEAELGTCDSATTSSGCSTVFNFKDSDRDGLTDFHETMGIDNYDSSLVMHLPAWGGDPRRKDVFIEQDWCENRSPAEWTSNPFTYALADKTQSKYSVATQSDVANLAGNGVWLHFDVGASGDPCPSNRTLCGPWGGGGQGVCSHALHSSRTGIFRHLLIYPSGGEAPTPGWWINAGILSKIGEVTYTHARAVIHELGHSVGLTHGGNWKWDGDPKLPKVINCKPNYASLMNYAFDLLHTLDTNLDYFNFSYGVVNTSMLDPRRLSESGSYDGFDASRLQYNHSLATLHKFPLANASGHVDWNRDNSMPESVIVRGSLVAAGNQCGLHVAVADEVEPISGVGSRSPDLADYSGLLYAFYTNPAADSVKYRSAPHSGNNNKGGCKSTSNGRPYEACHTFANGFTVPTVTGTVTSAVALEWNGDLVVAWRTSDRKIRVNRATGADVFGGTYELTGWAASATLVAEDADSFDIELAPMYVQGGSFGYTASEYLAIFYTNGTGSSAVHKMTVATSPLGTWSARDVKLTDETAVPGDEAPGVAIWPARTLGINSSSDISVGYACGLFPGRNAPPRPLSFLCYQKSSDRWTDRSSSSGIAGSVSQGRRPGIAFHTLRQAGATSDPTASVTPLGDGRRGQFWINTKDANGVPFVNVSTGVSTADPPGASLRFHFIEGSWPQDSSVSLTFFADREISSVKSIGLPIYGAVTHLDVGGMVDGAFNTLLKSGNDFQVMELGICQGLRDAAWCGTTSAHGWTIE